MEKIGEIEIRVRGKSGNIDLSPDNFDIQHIIEIMQEVENMLYPESKKNRPTISYGIENGSVRNIFKTSMQSVLAFHAVIGTIQITESIDFLQLKSARAIEHFQRLAIEKDYQIDIRTSQSNTTELSISPSTKYYRTENVWVDAEFYFYGLLTDAGGKNKANIHLDTQEFGLLTIETKKDYLESQEQNLLYKKYGVRVNGKQNRDTGELDPKSLQLITLIDYDPSYDEDYLNGLIHKAKKNWKGVNPEQWLDEIRGDYEV